MSQVNNQSQNKKTEPNFGVTAIIIVGIILYKFFLPMIFSNDFVFEFMIVAVFVGIVIFFSIMERKWRRSVSDKVTGDVDKITTKLYPEYTRPKQPPKTQAQQSQTQPQQSRAKTLKQTFLQRMTEEQAQDRSFVKRPSNAGEGHVPTIGMDQQAKLDQLERLKNAGLLDPEEYIEKRNKILRQK